jgi:hypothetical protein
MSDVYGGSSGGVLHFVTAAKTDQQTIAANVETLITYQTKTSPTGDGSTMTLGPPSFWTAPGTGYVKIKGHVYFFNVGGGDSYAAAVVAKLNPDNSKNTELSVFGTENYVDSTLTFSSQWYPCTSGDKFGVFAVVGLVNHVIKGDAFGTNRNQIEFEWAT